MTYYYSYSLMNDKIIKTQIFQGSLKVNLHFKLRFENMEVLDLYSLNKYSNPRFNCGHSSSTLIMLSAPNILIIKRRLVIFIQGCFI